VKWGNWREQAACYHAPEEDIQAFTVGAAITPASGPIAIDLNARYCGPCPVRVQCSLWAKDETTFSGIAGGYVWQASHDGHGNAGRKPPRKIPPKKETAA
jgi:hypothetical protein